MIGNHSGSHVWYDWYFTQEVNVEQTTRNKTQNVTFTQAGVYHVRLVARNNIGSDEFAVIIT